MNETGRNGRKKRQDGFLKGREEVPAVKNGAGNTQGGHLHAIRAERPCHRLPATASIVLIVVLRSRGEHGQELERPTVGVNEERQHSDSEN